jgi:hypothetical protein
MSREFLSLKTDYVFKKVFAESNYPSILANFLKSTLEMPESEFDKLEIIDPHLQRQFEGDKLSILGDRTFGYARDTHSRTA